jgi:hypothetical protein
MRDLPSADFHATANSIGSRRRRLPNASTNTDRHLAPPNRFESEESAQRWVNADLKALPDLDVAVEEGRAELGLVRTADANHRAWFLGRIAACRAELAGRRTP